MLGRRFTSQLPKYGSLHSSDFNIRRIYFVCVSSNILLLRNHGTFERSGPLYKPMREYSIAQSVARSVGNGSAANI